MATGKQQLGGVGVVVVALGLLLCVQQCSALIHDLKINNDNRKYFSIETFGFEANGELHMSILNFKLGENGFSEEYKDSVGFIISRTETDVSFEESITPDECRAKLVSDSSITVFINPENNGQLTEASLVIKSGEEGFYNTAFLSCVENTAVSFELKLEQYNVNSKGEKNYMSVGYTPLVSLYAVFTVVYALVLVGWIFYFLRMPGAKVNRIHHLMSVLVALKMLSLLFETVQYHFIETTGSGAGWDVVYYIFAILKGIMLFVVIALLGTGWSFLKPFLNEKDKKIILVVVPLQILDNIALIIIEETAPGSQEWSTWRDIFRLVDIICCGAILIPIVWSIKHLREASQIDGKAALNMRKLTLFRQFYLMVVSYIYFTRIIVFLVNATLPFRLQWLAVFFTEAATLAFFCVTGYKFRPAADNPYFSLQGEGEFSSSTDIEL